MTSRFKHILYDVEGDNLYNDITQLWCAVVVDLHTEEVRGFRPEELGNFIDMIHCAEVRVGHNIIDFDDPALDKLYGLKLDPKGAIDTLVMSRLFYPDRPGGHSLRSWGIRLGLHKGDFDDFSQFSEEMYTYCLQDGRVNMALLQYFLKGLGWSMEDLIQWRLRGSKA